jgi:hypothetical protein
MIFLQGSPILGRKNGVKLGRLSELWRILFQKYSKKNRMPSWETNCIEDWETKVNDCRGNIQRKYGCDLNSILGAKCTKNCIKKKGGKSVGEISKFQFIYLWRR